MALFPKCSFQVLLPGGVVVPGKRADGVLVVEAPEAIPRAEHLDLVFRSKAWVGYGSGKQRSVIRREVYLAPLHVDLPQGEMPAGTHRYPFSLDIPAWLPPGIIGDDCAIEHAIETRLDVDWAIDPVATVIPMVTVPPREGTRTPLVLRSPPWFHDAIVLEVSLASSVVAHDEPVSGQVALRSGHAVRFDAIDLCLASSFKMTMGRGDRRRGMGRSIRIPANMLRGGEAVPFEFPADRRVLPTVRSSFIDHYVVLVVSADIAWATDPSFEIVLDVLPPGSTLHGTGGAAVVGGARLRRLAAAMAQGTGLREGHPPTLVEGVVGPVALRVADAPREATLGIDVDLTFPDAELGITFRSLGMLEGFRESPLLPRPFGDRHLLRCTPTDARKAPDDGAVAAFVASVLSDLDGAEELRFSDHHLGAHFTIPNDGAERLVQIAQAARAKANDIAAALARLPFPSAVAAALPAWQATAAEQSAFLVPTGPSLHGLVFRARVLGGEERVVTAALRTTWTQAGPGTRVEVDLRQVPLPRAAWAELESGTSTTSNDGLRAVRAVFPSGHVLSDGRGATLDRPEWTADPRALLSAIETFVGWVLHTRGERRADLPYR